MVIRNCILRTVRKSENIETILEYNRKNLNILERQFNLVCEEYAKFWSLNIQGQLSNPVSSLVIIQSSDV